MGSSLLHVAPSRAQPSPSSDPAEPKTPYDAPPATSAPPLPSPDRDEPKTPYDEPWTPYDDEPPAASPLPEPATDQAPKDPEAPSPTPSPASAPPREAPVDPAVPTGLALTVVGGVSLIVGVAMLGAGAGRDCELGVGSCVTLTEGGTVLLAGSLGFLGTGVGAALGGMFNPHRHMSSGRMVAGIVLVGIGATNAAMGLAYVATFEENPLPWTLLGLGHLAIGAPLLASGAPEPAEGEAGPAMNSRAMANAGYALIPVGGAMFEAALLILFYPDDIVRLIPVYTTLGVGATVMIAAIPLVAVGRKREARRRRFDTTPSIRMGPTGGMLSWSF